MRQYDPDPNGNGGGNGGTPPAGGAPAATIDLGKLEGDAFRNALPEDFRGKPYLKDVNTFGDFLKKFDGAQTLIGQRQVPDDKATPEQWNEFYNKTGRPEKPEGYQIKADGLPADMQAMVKHPGFLGALWKSGISQRSAQAFLPELFSIVDAAEKAEQQQKDAAYAKLMDTSFGKDKDVIQSKAKEFLAAHLPDNMKGLLEGMDEKSFTVLTAMTDALAKKFVSEDGFRGGAGGGSGLNTADQIVSRMKVIMADKAYGDPFGDKTKRAALQAEMEELRKKLSSFQK
jgi:hypothetical protein